MALPRHDLSRYVDAAILDPAVTARQVKAYCKLAVQLGCAGVCVLPGRLELAATALAGSRTRVIGVVGFPLGGDFQEAKTWTAMRAIELGATELDMVWDLGSFLDDEYKKVENDIKGVINNATQAALAMNKPRPVVKVILECGALKEEQMVAGAQLVAKAGAHFVKTGTGMGPSAVPATVAQVKILRECLPLTVSVKAAGGIRSREEANALLAAGADRLGISDLDTVLGPIQGIEKDT